MNRIIFHVDMDAFYASVEQKDNPELRGKPVIIGANPKQRGVVSACSYEARTFGVHSAMPISRAYRLCPHGVFLPVRMERYYEISRRIMSLFGNYTPVIHQVSIDEAYLDMTGTERLFGPPLEAGRKIKSDILEETGLTLSIGIAVNHFVAKLASGYCKPDGLYEVKSGGEIEFIDRLKLSDLWGFGKKTIERLNEYNIRETDKLRSIPEETLKKMFGQGTGRFLYNAVRGNDPGILLENPHSRSLSSETTFEEDTRDEDGLKKVLLEMSHHLMFRAMKSGFNGRTVVLKLRYSDFETVTVQESGREPIASAEEIYRRATALLDKKRNRTKGLRLIGLALTGLSSEKGPVQPLLFQEDINRKNIVEQAVLQINEKGNRLFKASLLKKRPRRNGSLQDRE